MRTRVILALAAALMLIISTVAIGSNMGFKIVIPLRAGTNYIGLPYYVTLDGNSSPAAANLRNDIIAAGGTNVNVYNFTGNAWQRYAGGGIGQINFLIAAGNAYQVSSANALNWVVVGSHNPSAAVGLRAGTNYVAPPYHTTNSTAAMLRNELIATGATNVNVYNFTGTAWQRYAGGGIGQVNFTVTPGLGFQVSSAASVSSWVPAHY